MSGIYTMRPQDCMVKAGDPRTSLTLMLTRPGFEVMHQKISPDAVIWVTPGEPSGLIEFFYLLSGELSVGAHDEPGRRLYPGDCFYAENMTEDVRIVAHTDVELLYISNSQIFEGIASFQSELNELLDQIDAKDNITGRHSMEVIRYTAKLWGKLKGRLGNESVKLDDLATAAVFHDVGKCRIADEILKKKGRLTPEEYGQMKCHAAYSADILRPCFGDTIASIAYSHHERLDGSGYPEGLRGEDINLGARIIAVADSFSAMTAERPYNTIKTWREAVEELSSLPDKYEAAIVAALRELCESGELFRESEMESRRYPNR